MFFRTKKSGNYYYLQLVENKREGKKVKQRVIATLGRLDILLEKGSIKSLINSLSKFDEKLDVAIRYEKGQIKAIRKEIIGPKLLFGKLWEKTGIKQELKDIVKDKRIEFDFEKICFAETIHRIYEAGSDRQALKWLKNGEIIDTEGIGLHHFYRAMNILGERKDKVEEGLFLRNKNLFTRLNLVFFDTSSIHFEGIGGELGKKGYSKDKRPDKNQLVIGILLSEEGRPISLTIDEGSKVDQKVFLSRIDEFRKRFPLGEVCWVADRGIGTEKVISYLEEKNLKYIFGIRMKKILEVKREVLSRAGRYRKVNENLYVKEVKLQNGKRYIVCYNPKEAEKDKKLREELIPKLNEIMKRPSSLIKNKGYRRYLKTKKGFVEINWEKIREEERYDGKWVLRTNTALSSEEIAIQYKRLHKVERFFRTSKSIIRIRPVYHKNTLNINGHFFISFLGILLKYELESLLKKREIKLEWSDILRDIISIEQVILRINGKNYKLRLPLKGNAGKLFKIIGVKIPPHIEVI